MGCGLGIKSTTANKRYKTLGFKMLYKVSAPHQSSLSEDSYVARNPRRSIPPSVGSKAENPKKS